MKTNNILIAFALLVCTSAFSQVGINTATPDVSSVLDVTSTTKGVLTPRVNLTSRTLDLDDPTGANGQATGLLIYNIGSTFNKGFYYWGGTEWLSIDNSSTITPVISKINCGTAQLSPNTYTSGVPYSGTMTVTYSGGNGGVYGDGTAIASTGVTGLSATLLAGSLNNGSGIFTYHVSGTPSASSPATASFVLPTTLGGTGCTAIVGVGNKFAIGEIQSAAITVNAAAFEASSGGRLIMNQKGSSNFTTTNLNSAYQIVTSPAVKANFIVINGLRMDFMQSNLVANHVKPKFYNTTGADIIYYISSLSTNDQYYDGSGTTILSNAFSYKIDGNDDFSCNTGTTGEYVNAMLTFPNKEWYQITYYATRDAVNYYFFMTAQRLN